MISSSDSGEPGGGSSDDLKGLSVLLVEDSWLVGMAMQDLLEMHGANVAGPAATEAEAERLLAERTPDVAIVDFNLREGALADGLIDRLHAQGIRVVVISGYATVPVSAEKIAVLLQKPVSEAQLLSILRPIAGEKPAR